MTSHIDKIIALGERMVGNLNAMGVSATFNDGALTLADKILDVPGLVLDTNISWASSHSQCSVGQKITFTGKLYGYYNDTGEDNVDFCGIFKNAPLKLYIGETLIDTTVTDTNGEFIFEYTPLTSGVLAFKTVCEGGSNFNGCTSTVINVSVGSFDGLDDPVLVDGNQILSYVDEQQIPNSQYATLMVQLLNGSSAASVSGVPVEFYRYVDGVNDVYLDTVSTDSDGQSEYTYHSAGIGDISIYGKVGSFVSETYEVHDLLKYDSASSDKSNTYTKTDNISLSFDTDHYVAVSSVGSNVGSNFYGLISPNLAFTDDIEIECDIKQTSTASSIFGINVLNAMSKSSSDITHSAQISNYVGTKGITCNPWIDKRSQGSLSTNTWYHFKITITDGTITASIKQGDTTVYSDSTSYSYVSSLNNICLSVSQYPNTIHFKNLKIKPL